MSKKKKKERKEKKKERMSKNFDMSSATMFAWKGLIYITIISQIAMTHII